MTRERVRAIALAAIMLVSMVAVGVGGLAGSAIADSTELTVNDDGSGDYETIQAAVDNAESGDTIEVGPGTYEESITVDKQVTLRSTHGVDDTVIKPDEEQVNAIKITGNGDGTRIGADGHGFNITGAVPNNQAVETAAIYLSGDSITNLQVAGNEIVANGDAAVLGEYGINVSNLTITGNHITGETFVGQPAGQGTDNQFTKYNVPRPLVYISGPKDNLPSSDVTFTDNNVTGTTGGINSEGEPQGNVVINIDADGATMAENEFSGETAWTGASLRARGSDTVIKNNDFETGPYLRNHVALGDNAVEGGTEAVVKNNTFDKATYISGGSDIASSIGASVAGAVESDDHETINLEPGTYNESVTVDTNVTLKGPNAGTPGYERGTTDLSGEAVVGSSSGPDVNVEEGANVTVDGIVFNGDQTFIESKNWSRVSVKNSIFANGRSKGNGYIWLKGSSGQFEFNSNYVVNNTASNGIRLKNPDGSRINISVRHNVWENNGAWAMNVNHVHGTIEDNTIRNTDQFLQTDRYKQWGLLFAASNNNVSIKNNTFESLTGVGVDVYGDFNGEIHVSQNTFSNITTDAGGVLISDYVPGDGEFEGFQPDVEDVNISRNNFVNNNVSIRSEVGVRINARYNYFESAPTVEGNVAYDPLLTVPADQTSSEVQDIRNYGSYIEIESDGEPTVIGFPTPTAESLSDILSDDTIEREDGEAVSIYTYDNEKQSFESVGGDYVPDAGDVLVVTTEDSLADDFVVPVDTSVTDEAATPSQVQIYEGWNLVATGGADGPDDLAITEEVLAAGQFQTQPAQPGAQTAEIGAYEGTWLFAEDDGQLTTGYVEDQTPADYVINVLRENTEDDK